MNAFQVSPADAHDSAPSGWNVLTRHSGGSLPAPSHSFGNKLATFAGGFLKPYIGVDLGMLSGLIGDPLRNF